MDDEKALQRDIVNESSKVRDPADDSGISDDPEAAVETYPKAFDEKIENAESAIRAEAGTDHSPAEPNRSTDNDRDSQIRQSE